MLHAEGGKKISQNIKKELAETESLWEKQDKRSGGHGEREDLDEVYGRCKFETKSNKGG